MNDIEEREKIRATIQRGDVKEAIQLLNDFDPQVLEDNPKLIFALKQQHLLELIRRGDINEALTYAKNELVGSALLRVCF